MKKAVVSDIGYRFRMEDAHYLDMNCAGRGWVFGGVYDGHMGAFAAHFSAKYLHHVFLEHLQEGHTPEESFVFAYEDTSARLAFQESGTTAVTFLIKDRCIFTASAGDARAIVISTEEIHQLTVDHRVHNHEERTRILEMGGVIREPYVYRGGQGLMPSRSIGDEYFKSVGIIATPTTSRYEITGDDRFLIAACDGLFDVLMNDEVAEVVRNFTDPEPVVDALRAEVLVTRLGTDNLTIIAISLQD